MSSEQTIIMYCLVIVISLFSAHLQAVNTSQGGGDDVAEITYAEVPIIQSSGIQEFSDDRRLAAANDIAAAVDYADGNNYSFNSVAVTQSSDDIQAYAADRRLAAADGIAAAVDYADGINYSFNDDAVTQSSVEIQAYATDRRLAAADDTYAAADIADGSNRSAAKQTYDRIQEYAAERSLAVAADIAAAIQTTEKRQPQNVDINRLFFVANPNYILADGTFEPTQIPKTEFLVYFHAIFGVMFLIVGCVLYGVISLRAKEHKKKKSHVPKSTYAALDISVIGAKR